MKVGIYLATQFTPGTPLGPQVDNLVEQVRVARANGFASVWAAQHFITAPVQMFQTVPLLARLAPEAAGMQIGPNILVFPALEPVMVAEESATMDWLSDGNYVLGVGLGYRGEEFGALGRSLDERVGRMREGLDLVRRLWTEDRITHHGKHFHLDDVGLSLKPKQPKGPPVWVAAVVEKAIERAAVLGDEWLITFYPTITALEGQLKLYRTARAAAGLPPATDYPLCRECYVGPDMAAALAAAEGPLKYKYAAYASWGQDKILAHEDRFDQPFGDFRTDRFIIGDEAAVRDELQRYRDRLGVEHFIMRMQWPGLDQDLVLKSIERLGRIAATL
ncbi:alkanesulfonate monooxygenase SsuD/methylene tetrahydromethanopterin reductase-like flavin-dependent oxidoreductase (luciferase family) [Constrictibacter sp. MBR-5]|uniref:LLM class flavin-dependent oxidoreductase n=1 Tax=Constrictibacter sp. MBR-5 TaxID=3156467 RepID=UPI00339B9516